jgi:hypothetical protein
MPTLLEKAKAFPQPRQYITVEPLTDEHLELIFAYLNSEITTRQASMAIGGKTPGNFTHWLATSLTRLYREKRIRIEVVKQTIRP